MLQFMEKAIVPELLCRTMYKSNDKQNRERKSCICKNTYNENSPMVCCDNCNNWYHADCLKLKDFPKVKKWYCKLCKSFKKYFFLLINMQYTIVVKIMVSKGLSKPPINC